MSSYPALIKHALTIARSDKSSKSERRIASMLAKLVGQRVALDKKIGALLAKSKKQFA